MDYTYVAYTDSKLMTAAKCCYICSILEGFPRPLCGDTCCIRRARIQTSVKEVHFPSPGHINPHRLHSHLVLFAASLPGDVLLELRGTECNHTYKLNKIN